MAQKWRTRPAGQKTAARPLDAAALEALALAYVGRFATSRARLVAYLERKLGERGWADEAAPAPRAVAERLAALRYVDDAAYAAMKSGAMQSRGLGTRRIAQALRQDGIDEALSGDAAPDARGRWAAAERLARRKRIGPFSAKAPDKAVREKQLAAFLRAGHDLDLARRWVDAAPGVLPDPPEDLG